MSEARSLDASALIAAVRTHLGPPDNTGRGHDGYSANAAARLAGCTQRQWCRILSSGRIGRRHADTVCAAIGRSPEELVPDWCESNDVAQHGSPPR